MQANAFSAEISSFRMKTPVAKLIHPVNFTAEFYYHWKNSRVDI